MLWRRHHSINSLRETDRAEDLRARIVASEYLAELMPRPICSRCAGDQFGMEKMQPKGAAHPVNIVKCLNCGSIVGVVPLEEATTLINRLSERVRRLCVFLGFDVDMG